ncbi:hypothetical protein ACGWZA_001388 [Enterococcus hirae]|uniref:hypothetical protein n=1 Tax=Enterococcus hirae TaxID=1354 RepID=UPI00159AF9D8|nr:hypothetical protein [Enterococcus hirae]QKX68424.1 hypothetical protein HU255_04530 [Enterococcus hirae]
MKKQNTQESRSGLEESAVQQDIHSIHTEQTVSDRQQKDQSEMMYVKLVGMPEADVNQISVTPGKRVQPVYKTPEQFKAFLSELIKPSTTSSHSYEHLLPTQGAPASLHQDMDPAPPLPPRNMKTVSPSSLRSKKPAQKFDKIIDRSKNVATNKMNGQAGIFKNITSEIVKNEHFRSQNSMSDLLPMAKGQSAEHSREVTSRQGRERPEMQLGGTMEEKNAHIMKRVKNQVNEVISNIGNR